jgi:hypothetical protein
MSLALLLLLAVPQPPTDQTGIIDVSALTLADAFKLDGRRVVARVELSTPGYELKGVAGGGCFARCEAAVFMPARLARQVDEDEGGPLVVEGLLRVVVVEGWGTVPGWVEVRVYVEAVSQE